MMKLRRGPFALILSLAMVSAMSTPAQAEKLGPRPNWGACGTSTSDYKMVYDFGGINLKCGNASWGYRHIKARHYNEFQTLAGAGRLNWSDLVHWAIHHNVKDPDHVVVEQGDGCRDRMLFLHDRNGRLVWQQRFKVIYSAIDGRVITAYPSSAICVR